MNIKKAASFHELPGVLVVEASAGSGKTYALAKRYLQLLINPASGGDYLSLRSILAITFTNKATIEMKGRILELLKRLALDLFTTQDESEDVLRALGVSGSLARQKAQAALDCIVANYNFFQVKTIDSFINALLLGCAFQVGRSAHFSIKRDYRRQLNYCLDLVIDQAAVDREVFSFLEDFLQHYLFVENRQGWFPRDDILQFLEALFRISNKHARLFKLSGGAGKDVIKKKKDIFFRIEQLYKNLPDGLRASTAKAIKRFLENNDVVFNTSALPAVFQNPQPPLNKGKNCPISFYKQWEDLCSEITGLIELEAAIVYDPYIQFFYQLIHFFSIITKKEDVLFLEELNRTAHTLFENESFTVAEAYYRLASRFKHYLIDEFQDTSRLQWDNLYLMIEDALASGGSLFYVGDKKQAIYRFRGGRVELFDEVRKKFSHFTVSTDHLVKNWRSQKEIVNFNNSLFSPDNLRRALFDSGITGEIESFGNVEEIISVFSDSFQEHRQDKNGGYVKVEYIEEENQRQRDEIINPKIIKLIGELKDRFSYRDIAVLTRDNNEVELVTSWLLAAGIPVKSEKTLNVMENDLIKGLVSFLRFLHSPIDDVAFASFITSDFFSRCSGLGVDEIRNFIFILNRDNSLASQGAMYREFRKLYASAWDVYIEDFFNRVGFVSSYELCLGVYERYKVFDVFPFAEAFFMKFLELIKSKEDEAPSLSAMLAYLQDESGEDFYVNLTEADSVGVLTIHKSKGLEFPVVIIPFLRVDITPETVGKGSNSYIADDDADRLGLLRVTKVYRQFSKNLQKVYARNYQKACLDELNALYVALTRAEEELYIFLPRRSSGAKNKARDFMASDNEVFGSRLPSAAAAVEKADSRPQALKAGLCYDWISRVRSEFKSAAALSGRARLRQGVIAHAILSRINNCFAQEKEAIFDKAIAALEKNIFHNAEVIACGDKVKGILLDERFDKFFSHPQAEVFTEKEISNAYGDLKRLDRLIINKDSKTVWIIDYKLAADDHNTYREQIKEYKELCAHIYPGYAISGFLIYLEERAFHQV
jgi:ATP-dependent helicase/nuclease subunit A